VRKTRRYSLCEVGQDQFDVMDDRYLLDQLLRLPELRPTTNDLMQIEFEEALESLSSGPTLTVDDRAMLGWLTSTVEELDPKGENTAFDAAYDRAVVFRGTIDEVEYFIRAVLDHRVH
jgi:hypothetical protein